MLCQLRYHRKYAIRLLNGVAPGSRPRCARRRRGVHYGPPVLSILKAVWEAADYPWSVRLKALLPGGMPWIRRRYQAPPTPFERLCACPTASLHRDRVAELQQLRESLDPFALSQRIQRQGRDGGIDFRAPGC